MAYLRCYIILLYVLNSISSYQFRNRILSIRQNYFQCCMISSINEKTNNVEERLRIDTGIKPCSFLTNIIEYGNNRMARRAVGILSKMPAYKVEPTIDHYNAALWACENSDAYELGQSVYLEMLDLNIQTNINSFEAIISLAERTSHYEDMDRYYQDMKDQQFIGTTAIFNSLLWSCDKAHRYDKALEYLSIMEENNIKRDETSYSAALQACENAFQDGGVTALHILDLIKYEGIDLNIITANSIIWACVRNYPLPMATEALELFDSLDSLNIPKNVDTYNGAIWAYEASNNLEKAFELLRLMKFERIERSIVSFNGVLSVFMKNIREDLKQQFLDIFTWIGRDGLQANVETYHIAIEAMDKLNDEKETMEFYLKAMRENKISPWFKDTRMIGLYVCFFNRYILS